MTSSLYKAFILLLITLGFLSVSIETDIYVPAMPCIREYFQSSEVSVQGIVTFNFLGLCFSSLIYGPLSDRFGRRPVLLIGMATFVLASLICCFTESMIVLLVARFSQGLGSGAPMCLGATIVYDLYNEKQAASIISCLNGIISASLAGAPILGSRLTHAYGWRSNFYLILLFAVVSFFLLLLFFKESHDHSRRICSAPMMDILKMYGQLLAKKEFRYYTLLLSLLYSSIIIYISNLSLVFIQHLFVSESAYSFYQATIMLSFMLASILAGELVRRFGIPFMEKIGLFLFSLGAAMLCAVSFLNPLSAVSITLSMALASIGNAFCFGIFGVKAMGVLPGFKGSASSLSVSFRLLFASLAVLLTGYLYNGTMLPVAMTIFLFDLIALYLFFTKETPRQETINVS